MNQTNKAGSLGNERSGKRAKVGPQTAKILATLQQDAISFAANVKYIVAERDARTALSATLRISVTSTSPASRAFPQLARKTIRTVCAAARTARRAESPCGTTVARGRWGICTSAYATLARIPNPPS